jgi:hypothetical protein
MTTPPTDRPLTAGEALAKLFMDNADRGANAANDTLIEQLQQRIRALRKTRDDPDRPPVERSPRQLPVAGRHHSGRSDPGPGAVDAGVPVGVCTRVQRQVILIGGAWWNRTTVRPVQ